MVMAWRRWCGSGGKVVTVVEVMMLCRGCSGGWWVWRGGVDGGCRGVWWPEHGRMAPEFGRKKRGGGGWWLGTDQCIPGAGDTYLPYNLSRIVAHTSRTADRHHYLPPVGTLPRPFLKSASTSILVVPVKIVGITTHAKTAVCASTAE
ncbi:hypothetical protein Tco_1577046 [Tanacetum coccineum]